MIISVICPNCGKKIQIDDSNDANICICCNRAFVTEKAQRCDGVSAQAPVQTPTQTAPPKQATAQDAAERYFKNVLGLLEKGKDESDGALCSNLNALRNQFPLDPRLQAAEFRLALQSYKKATSHKNGYVKKAFEYLDGLVGTDYYDECYDVLKEEAKKVCKSEGDGSLYLKLILQDVNPNAILKYYASYKKEKETYQINYKGYQNELRNYESKVKRYEKDLERYQKASLEGTTLPPFPWKPSPPIAPRGVSFGDPSVSVLDEVLPLIGKQEKEDFDYLTAKYCELAKYCEAIRPVTSTYDSIVKKLYSLLPLDYRKKMEEEERARKEKIRAEKTAKTLFELKKFWEYYISLLKAKKFKDAYKYLTYSKKIEDKQIPTHQELTKFSKTLFSTKYNGDVNQLDAENLAKITFKNMNFSF